MFWGKRDDRGATAVEYVLLVVSIAAVLVFVLGMRSMMRAVFSQQVCHASAGYECQDNG